MKTILFLIVIMCTAFIVKAQPCGEVEGLRPIQLVYTFDGRPGTSIPVIPGNWNRLYKLNETTGDLSPEGCVFPCCPIFGACVCYLQGVYFRRVTPPCDPTPCGGDIPLPGMPRTDNNSVDDKWSQSGAWMGGQVPVLTGSPAIVITKPLQLDANLNLTPDHWLVFASGSSFLAAASSVTNNSVIKVSPSASFENFGLIKGTGQVYGNFINSGVMSPGNSPGKFTITGNYTATGTAVTDIEIASLTSFDTVGVEEDVSFASGNAIINGTLNVTLLNGYEPTLGDSYHIFNYATSSGNFSTINFPPMPIGLAWNISYNATDITLTVVGAALPLHFQNARATLKNNGVQVEWTAENEIDVQEYEIERSADGIKFNKIGVVNTSSNKEYGWFDANPMNGNNYYRVKAIDIDGKFIYSGILFLKVSGHSKIIIYPNPVKRGGIIEIGLASQKASKVEIVNIAGQTIFSKALNITGQIRIPVQAAWPAGQYILRLTLKNEVEIFKVQIW